jgi:general secretion pathway protein G
MTRNLSRRRRRGAFTLLEVLLVLAILVILGSMVTVFFARTQQGAYEKAARAQISAFEQAIDLYRLHVGTYPSASQGLESLRVPPADLKNPLKWQGPYIKDQIPLDPWDNPYQYEVLDTSAMSLTPYRILSWGADGVEGTEDDISNLMP